MALSPTEMARVKIGDESMGKVRAPLEEDRRIEV